MRFFLEEKRVAIYYNPIYREYYIKLWSYPEGKHAVYYCPWCGYEFPQSLIKDYFDTLDKEYKIWYIDGKHVKASEDATKESIEVELPEEFESDKWWKKRGL